MTFIDNGNQQNYVLKFASITYTKSESKLLYFEEQAEVQGQTIFVINPQENNFMELVLTRS